MPEGPTIRVTADKLRAALLGRRIEHFSCSYKKATVEAWAPKIVDRTVLRVRSHGKNLFVEFDSGWVLYTHMLMWGSWHVYAPGETWAKEERKARVVLQTAEAVAVLFSAPVCELVLREQLAAHRTSELGPDLLEEDFDMDEAARRFFDPLQSDRQIGDLVMDQTVLAGIGNILKSEILFQAGINPLRPAKSLTQEEWTRLIATSQELMQRAYSTQSFVRAFMPAELREETGRWAYVYRRGKKPCLRCGTPIQMVRQGLRERMTFFCPACQPDGEEHRGYEAPSI